MSKMVNIKIDGKEIKVPEGTNLIDAAELAGIHIPNLCYLKGLPGIGACRLCLVEIEGSKAPMIACNTKVKEGMVVHTKTEKVQEIRKFVIDLILSMHPLDCMTCTKAGACDLQRYAYEFELKDSSFTRKSFGFSPDESNPFIKRDPNYCILCGRCVRVCKNQDTNVLDFMGRGVGSKVTTANDKPLQESGCTFCGSCVDVCPVNALVEADRWRKGREWEYRRTNSVCLLCGNSCDVIVSTKNGSIAKINAGGVEGSSERYICALGRFGFDSIEADSRITTPMKRVNGELVETTWDDALDIVANALKKAGENAGIISTAGILNEDALALKKLASDVIKTKNLDTTASLYGDEETLINGGADLESADLFVLVDLNPNQWKRVLPALDAIIRRRLKTGAKLIVINSNDPNISSQATVKLGGSEIENLKSLTKALIDKGLKSDSKLLEMVKDATISEAIDKAATLYMEAKNPVIISSPAMYNASSNIALLKGVAVSVPVESNAKGVIMMGIRGDGKSYKEMTLEETALLYAIGEVPLNVRPNTEFLIVQNSHLTGLAKEADIVLPSATFFEADGTIVDYFGRIRCVCKAVEPVGDAKTHRDIFSAIAKKMGVELKEPKESEIKKLTKILVKKEVSPFEQKEGFDADVNEMIESLNTSVICGSRLLWLKESSVCV